MKIRFGLILSILALVYFVSTTGFAGVPTEVKGINADGTLIVGYIDQTSQVQVGRVNAESAFASTLRRSGTEIRDTIIFGVPEFFRQNHKTLLFVCLIFVLLGLIDLILLTLRLVGYVYGRTTHGRGRWSRYNLSRRQALRHALRQINTSRT